MSSTSTSAGPGFELKHRITGAVILIGFAMIVLPMVLGGPAPELRGSAPEPVPDDNPDTKVFVSKITPIGGEPPATRPVLPAPPPDTAVAPPQSRPEAAAAPTVTPADAPPSSAESPPVAIPQRAPEKTAAAPAAEPELERGWIVQVGVFSKPENADKLSALLEKRGFKPESGRMNTKSGDATRVWIGPYVQRVEAARMRSRVEQAIGEKGLIVAYP